MPSKFTLENLGQWIKGYDRIYCVIFTTNTRFSEFQWNSHSHDLCGRCCIAWLVLCSAQLSHHYLFPCQSYNLFTPACRCLVSFNATASRVFVWLEIVFALSFWGEVYCMLKILYFVKYDQIAEWKELLVSYYPD